MTQLPRWAGDDKNLVALFVTQASMNGRDYDLTRLYAERICQPCTLTCVPSFTPAW